MERTRFNDDDPAADAAIATPDAPLTQPDPVKPDGRKANGKGPIKASTQARARKGYSYKDYAAALRATDGMTALAAKRLGVSRIAVIQMKKAHPELQDIIGDGRERHLDTAESKLREAVEKGQAWAICFTLKTIGRSRGYIERTENWNKDVGPITKDNVQQVRTENLLETAKLLTASRNGHN